MPPTLFGVSEKRDWANHHFTLIEKSISDYIDSNPCRVITDRDPERGIYKARLHYPRKLDVRSLALMIGDCAHNMRCALDYIAWELAGHDLSDKSTMFPICDSVEEFEKIKKKRIGRLPIEAQTAIERLQPYNTRYGGDRLALSAINKLDNDDKHRVLILAVTVTGSGVAEPHVFPRIDTRKFKAVPHFVPSRIQHDAVVATYTIDPPAPEVDVEFKIVPQILFSPEYKFKKPFVLPLLQRMLNSVDVVIKRMRTFFPSTQKE